MKLSAAFVAEHLQKSYNLYVPYELSSIPCLMNPVLYTPGIKLKDHTVYVVNNDEVDTLKDYEILPKHSLFIVAGNKNNFKYPNICILDGNVNAIDIFSQIQELFNKYNNWQDNLIKAYLEGKSIDTMLSISLPIFNNSLFVTGMDFTIVAAAFIDPTIPQEGVFGSSQNTHYYVTALKNSKLFQEVKNLNNAFYFPSHVTGLASLCVNIKQNNRTTYRLVMLEDNRKISKNEGFLLEFLALLIQRILNPSLIRNSNRVSNDYMYLSKIFLDILYDENVDFLDASHKLNSEGWLSSHKYLCASVRLTEMDKQNHTYYPIIYYLKNIFSHSCPFLYKNKVVIFINMTLCKLSLEEIVNYMEEFVEKSQLNVGISRSLSGHMNLRYQYIQSQIALSIGMEISPDKLVHTFNDVSYDYMLRQFTNELPATMIVHEKLLELIDIDKSKNTEYIKTLSTYFKNRFNALQTAERLYIHRSTLMYRLDKIKNILGSDLKDPKELLYIKLSLCLLGYL